MSADKGAALKKIAVACSQIKIKKTTGGIALGIIIISDSIDIKIKICILRKNRIGYRVLHLINKFA